MKVSFGQSQGLNIFNLPEFSKYVIFVRLKFNGWVEGRGEGLETVF